MKFLDTGDKIKKLRKELNIKQEELNEAGVSRNFISMVENGKRKLPYHVASNLVKIFNNKADKFKIELNIDEKWLLLSAKQQAMNFCCEKLNSTLTPNDIDLLTNLVKVYEIDDYLPRIFMLKADQLYNDRFYEEAFTYYYEILEHTGNNSEKAFIYNKLGKCKIKMQNYFEAITYLNKCYINSQESNDIINKRNYLYNIALCYRKSGKIDLALESINEFLSLCNIDKDFKQYMSAVILKANCYTDIKKLFCCNSTY